MHRNSRNFSSVEPKLVLNSFIFLPLFFFLMRLRYLLFCSSFYSSLSLTFMFMSSPSKSFSPCSLFCCSLVDMKFLHIFNCSSIYFSMDLRVKSLMTSCLLLVILFITGIMNSTDMHNAHDALISKYKKMFMLKVLELSDSSMMASVDFLRATSTEFRLFLTMKKVVGLLSVISTKAVVEMR